MTIIINFNVFCGEAAAFKYWCRDASVSKAEQEQILFVSKCLGVRVCKNCLINSESLPILWETEIEPSGSWVQQLSTELNILPFLQVLRTFLSRE